MYWTRDIMNFFQIEQEDINIFLNFHQVYKHTILQKMQHGGFDVEVKKNTGRSGSYWVNPFEESGEYDSKDKERSFYVKLENYVIQDNYVQGGGGNNG